MSKIRIVVDSAVDFPAPTISKRYHITVVPYTIRIGEETLLDGEDIDAEQLLQRIGNNSTYPIIDAPTVEQYADAFLKLSTRTDQILVLTTTHTLGKSFENAKKAAASLQGRCNILVLDSKTTSVGLGLLAEITAEAAEKSESIENVVRIARGAIDRIYAIFYVDTLDFIRHSGLLGEAQAVLGTMLGIKPFLTIEDGNLMTMEKVRTRSQAVDKLVEFVTEFEAVEKLIIMQNSPYITESVRLLQDRLATVYGKRTYPTILYGPLLATYLGPDATGVIVLEKEF